MKLTTDEAFEKIKEAGITQNKFIFLKMVREGKVAGKMISKKRGYRFEEEDIDYFIERFTENEDFHMTEELIKLKEENDQLKRLMKMPKEYWIKENKDLRIQLKDAQRMIQEKEDEIEKLIHDSTIRIRVE